MLVILVRASDVLYSHAKCYNGCQSCPGACTPVASLQLSQTQITRLKNKIREFQESAERAEVLAALTPPSPSPSPSSLSSSPSHTYPHSQLQLYPHPHQIPIPMTLSPPPHFSTPTTITTQDDIAELSYDLQFVFNQACDVKGACVSVCVCMRACVHARVRVCPCL